MPDDQEERFRQHEAIMAGLARILEAQHARNERLDAWMERQDTLNERLTSAIERLDHSIERIDRTLAHVEITQARMETLFVRVFRPQENGQDT